jgi:hypothetical protein
VDGFRSPDAASFQLASLKKNGAGQGTPEGERRNVNTRRPEVKRESVFLAVPSNVPRAGNQRLASKGAMPD